MRAADRAIVTIVAITLVAACSGSSTPSTPSTSGSASGTPPGTTGSASSPSTSPPASSRPAPTPTSAAVFRDEAAMATVRRLAVEVGPREATSPAFRRAADWVATQFAGLGYDVAEQPLRVPSGVSWGVPVPAGTTWNVVARPRALQPGAPYLLVGAHLDTVPQAPGAEDNASGVAVLLETARLATALPTRLPVVFVAFGAEEPRNDAGTAHHFGSRALVARLSGTERGSLAAMVALDRVGVGHAVPICHGAAGSTALTRSLRTAARSVDVPTRSCGTNRASDHWSFERAGMPGARIGSTPYAGYHSARDLPRVVSQAQLGRVGRVLWEWLKA